MSFGDAEDAELPAGLPLGQARWVVSILSDADINRALIAALRAHGYTSRVVVAAHNKAGLRVLKKVGAGQVFHPYHDATDYAAEMLQRALQGNQGNPT